MLFFFSKNTIPILTKFHIDECSGCQISLLTFQGSRSKFKVKIAVLKIFYLAVEFEIFAKFGNLADMWLPEIILA